MKKEDIPQDPTSLVSFTKELCYGVDETGKYATGLSSGWEVKAAALGVAWEDIKQRISEARTKVEKGEATPILFFMEYRLMDMPLVAAYTGFWKWQIKRHLKPAVFKKLSKRKLEKYAKAFEVSVEDLINMKINEN